jgi:hypothetical protein
LLGWERRLSDFLFGLFMCPVMSLLAFNLEMSLLVTKKVTFVGQNGFFCWINSIMLFLCTSNTSEYNNVEVMKMKHDMFATFLLGHILKTLKVLDPS